MKTRWILPIVGIVLVLTLTAGFAWGAGRSEPPQSMRDTVAACDAMHDSPAMQQMMDRLPSDLREQCNAVHGQMLGMMSQTAGMMSGSDMMSG